ncbi:hypothetical protein DID88_001157 [Monilinia fructigena]|uniref:Uncharacterized protein n=1 Tax=Monilinia fructigena TaxID=38457 RepID=A0A395IXN7_9HELO|nr:hypothetical protein DID88_001157 [Monilinia fructigena]
MDEAQQKHHRKKAIDMIRKMYIDDGRVAVIAGHFMLWDDKKADLIKVWTPNDAIIYSHIIYLDIPADIIQEYRSKDEKKHRFPASKKQLQEWMQREVAGLGKVCAENEILLMSVHTSDPLNRVLSLLYNFMGQSEPINLYHAKTKTDDFVARSQGQLETALVIDGDRTLVSEDTGELFWQIWMARHGLNYVEHDDPTKVLFKSELGYSYTAFRQATLIYDELTDKAEFEDICHEVASMSADMEMLKAANNAIFVVSEVHNRSKTMEAELLNASITMVSGHFRSCSREYMATSGCQKASIIKLTDQNFLQSMLRREIRPTKLQIRHSTGRTCETVGDTTRDARIKGPALMDCHRSIGRYLAVEHISDLMGVESYEIPHFQGHQQPGIDYFTRGKH